MTAEPEPSPLGPSARRRSQGVIAAGFLIPLAVYLRTLAPTVVGGDSGELITSAHLLGIPHPTGYPLYMLLARAAQVVPIGSVAYRTNLLSALCVAAACAVLAWAYLRAGGSRPGALLAALAGAFLGLVWRQATRADVYALNALFVAAIVALFVHWQRARSGRPSGDPEGHPQDGPKGRSLVALSAVCGLALTHHRTSLCFALPFMGAALLLHRPLPGRLLGKIAVAFVLPLLLYLYLPLRAGRVPVANWGDPGNLGAFLHHVIRAQDYPLLRPGGRSSGAFLGQALLRAPAQQWTPLGLALAVAGWCALFWRRRALWAALSIAVILTVGLAARRDAATGAAWMLPAYLVMAAWLAAGTEAAARGLSAAAFLGPGLRRGLGALVLTGLAVALPARLVWANWSSQDASRDWGVYDSGRLMFAEAGRNSVVILSDDSLNGAAMYLQAVERRRPDVRQVWAKQAGQPWYHGELAAEAAQARRQSFPEVGSPDQAWAAYFIRWAALRLAGSAPIYSNLRPADLPAGYWILEGRILNQIVARKPRLLVRDAPDLPLRTESLFGQVTYAQLPELALRRGVPATPLGWGAVLLLAEPKPRSVRPGEVFEVRCLWRLEEDLEQALAVRTEFVRADWLLAQSDLAAEAPEAARLCAPDERPLLYGVLPLAANRTRNHYEEVAHYVAGRDPAPGRYLMRVALRAGDSQTLPVPVARVDLVEAGRHD